MTLTKIWNYLCSVPLDRNSRPLPGVNSAEAFHAILEQERLRAERYEHALTLVIFHLDNPLLSQGGAVRLTRVLAQRKRSTDELGWFNDRSIAVILPNTSADRARYFADDVSRKIANLHGDSIYTIHEYRSPAFLHLPVSRPPLPPLKPPRGSSPSATDFAGSRTLQSQTTLDGPQMFFPRGIPTWKRIIDVVVSLFLLVALSPLFALIAIFILVVSPGPVFFRQQRLGYMGQLFQCWKFRTMRVGVDSAVHHSYLTTLIHSDTPMTKLDSRSDPRIIPLGHLLRQTALDELPQLFNVLGGDMSLIGPRPCLPYEAQEYSLWHAGRFATLPGLTGLWQVSGKNRTTFKEMIRFDLAYIRNMSPAMDAVILLKTVPAIIAQIKDFLSQSKGDQNEELP